MPSVVRDVVANIQKVFAFILVRLHQAVNVTDNVTDDDQAITGPGKCDVEPVSV